MKEKATIFNYARMCNHFDDNCQECPMFYKQTETGLICKSFIRNCPDKANEIILNWCKEHPVETRQDRFLKMFPNAKIDVDGALSICPQFVNKDFSCQTSKKRCSDCCKDYWLAEVEENEERERLVELLLESEPIKERDLDDDWGDNEISDIAEHLLENGVVVLPAR